MDFSELNCSQFDFSAHDELNENDNNQGKQHSPMLIVCDNCGGDEFRINDRLIAVCTLCGNKIKLCDGDSLKFKEEEGGEKGKEDIERDEKEIHG